jgi:hypothetical protein
MKTKTRWTKTQRNPERVIGEVRRSCREHEFSIEERQTGSHWCGKVLNPDGSHRGTVVIPRHGELPKGTWRSVYGMIVKLGLAVLVVATIGALMVL